MEQKSIVKALAACLLMAGTPAFAATSSTPSAGRSTTLTAAAAAARR